MSLTDALTVMLVSYSAGVLLAAFARLIQGRG